MKKLIIILIPIILLGTGAGLALTGIIKIPGLTPKAKTKAAQLYTETPDPKVAEKKPDPPAPPKKPTPKPPKVEAGILVENKPEAGQKKLAKLWNEIDTPALSAMVKDWKDPELAGILIKMDAAKVAELLTALDPKRASAISRELQKQASIVAKT